MLTDGIDGLDQVNHDICVIGSGPVGLALGTRLAKHGKPARRRDHDPRSRRIRS